ncbi:synaptonemal complex protein 2-like isoform X5 [Astatotilapia calliptera]|uniref:synaptonemal complex protein 2-like isoform X5 n=1 Tax=Astatotilapia calliptera TaxID=8154 RepID=UPI000E3FB41D|nr:synaptonemal complex protein 2-like isoform X5 [Astatotilapia calliptera]
MFEVQVEDCMLHGDTSHLASLLYYEGLTSSTLTRLDQLVTKELRDSGFSRAMLVLKSLGILAENKEDLQMLIGHGLTAKALMWFEAVCERLTSDLQRISTPLLNLTEEFFDFFLVTDTVMTTMTEELLHFVVMRDVLLEVGQSCIQLVFLNSLGFMLLGQASLPVSQLSVVLLQLVHLTLETEVHFPLRLEAIRTFNSVLESLSREQRRLIQNDQNQNQMLPQVAAAVLTVGDYELQVSLSEALCRMTPRRDRMQKASQWFSIPDISMAFCDIRDADFESDCRRFLNFVNCYHGNQGSVYTIPCLRAFLSSTQLFRPKDEKLDEFWIDFNTGSGCVSFFIDEPQGFLWGSIHVPKEEVDHYSLQVKQNETVLSFWLNNPIMHHNVRGQTVELTFNSKHHKELEEAAGRVFMKVQNTPHVKDPGGTAQASTTNKHGRRAYGHKKAPSKSQLKILPLSSPSSEDDSTVSKPAARSAAEVLFDQIRHTTSGCHSFHTVSDVTVETHLPDAIEPVSDDPKGVELQVSQDFEESSFPLEQEVFRKRKAPDSGYLSDQTEGELVHKRRAAFQQEGEGSKPLSTAHLVIDRSPEELGLLTEEAGPPVDSETCELRAVTESDLMYGITASIKTFRAQLEEHFTGHWQKVETEILLSLKEQQQHVSALLMALHQHRLLLLQRLEKGVSDQSEMQRLSSFCAEQQQRLKSSEGGEAGVEHPASQ